MRVMDLQEQQNINGGRFIDKILLFEIFFQIILCVAVVFRLIIVFIGIFFIRGNEALLSLVFNTYYVSGFIEKITALPIYLSRLDLIYIISPLHPLRVNAVCRVPLS